MPDFLAEGSLALVFAALLAAGMGLPVNEDTVILATGAMADRDIVPMPWALIVCYVGVLCGDFILFSAGRHLGPRMLKIKFFQRILPEERRQKTELMFARRGPIAVFISRFLIGFRIPGFATAGLLGMSPWRFLFWDALGAAITAPLVFGAGYFFSNRLDEIEGGLAAAADWVLVAVIVGALVAFGVWYMRRRSADRSPQIQTESDDANDDPS